MLLFLSCGSAIKDGMASELSFVSKRAQPRTIAEKIGSSANFKMDFSAVCAILSVFYIHSALAGIVTEKLKLSHVSASQNDACPPGVWTCPTGKRSEIASSYPPGIWTRDETEKTKRLNDEDPQSCPPGMWVFKKKRMLKQMLKTAIMKSSQDGRAAKLNPSQASYDACPPGVWTCSTGKRSDIIQEGEVIVKASVLEKTL